MLVAFITVSSTCTDHRGRPTSERCGQVPFPFPYSQLLVLNLVGWQFMEHIEVVKEEIWRRLFLVGGFKHGWIIFHVIYGMPSFPLTFIFFKMVIAPPTRFLLGSMHINAIDHPITIPFPNQKRGHKLKITPVLGL